MTLFTVDGTWGMLIFLTAIALWLAGLVDSAGRERWAWTCAILVFNFPAAIAWFAMRNEPKDQPVRRHRRARHVEAATQESLPHEVGTEESRREQLRHLARLAEDESSD